jgi:hypothetical protein
MAYLIIMIAVLLPSLGDLTILFCICTGYLNNAIVCFKGFLIWKTPANWYILVGAIIFVSSDSILAFNKFYEPVVLSSFLL